MDDDLLKEFINESREHLADIEADILTIEEGGADIDDLLVNKVFRAAHSIKGGSAFFGLTKVKDLAHKAETVLDMLRSRKMAPNAEITNILLAAFDRLRDMINNTAESEQADISDLLVSLTGLASSYLPTEEKGSLYGQVTLMGPGNVGRIILPQTDVDRAGRTGQYIYWVDCDLIHDIEKKGVNILSLFSNLTGTGELLDCAVDFEAIGSLEGPIGNRVPLRLVVATILEPDVIGGIFETISEDRIHLIFDPRVGLPEGAVQVPETVAPPPVPSPGVESPAPRSRVPSAPVSQPRPEFEDEENGEDESHPAAPVSIRSGARRPASMSAPAGAGAVEETLRVNVKLLNNLMNLAGELVLSRNQLRAAVTQDNRRLLNAADQRINQVTSELQDVIMQTRLQPIGNVFSKFPRVVRDLSQSLGKEIRLDIQGKDVALDKTLIEGLSDPLTHMVRNAVDHGVESTEERLRAGKDPAGSVHIEARHEAGQVVVEITDDGKGIDPEKVVRTAIRKGLITEEKVLGLSDRDKQALIFLPGLSTTQNVSDVSGRGVGMDVVKTNLDRMGGQVEISSEVGKGSIFRIKLPLTLAIIPSLIVSVEGERFAIPQANIEELLRLRPEQVKDRIEIVGDSEVLLLRDRVLPLVRFADVLGAIPTYIDPQTGRREVDRRTGIADRRSARHPLTSRDNAAPSSSSQDPSDNTSIRPRKRGDRRRRPDSAIEIAVVTTGNMSYGLVVGAFHDTEEVVVKPLGSRLKNLREYSGATILGDGAVALILDMAGLAEKAKVVSVSGSERAAQLAELEKAQRLQDIHSLLLFHNNPSEPCAVPLDLVQRIERITPDQVEYIGGQRTMQYRGGSLPLVSLSDAASVSPVDHEKDLVVLVSRVGGREVGLLGAMPVDVIELDSSIDQVTQRQRGIAGSAIIHNRTTLIADIYELVDAVYPNWNRERVEMRDVPSTPTGRPAAVLLAEDSDFFRTQVKKYLEEDGLNVLDAPDGEAAWELLLMNLDAVRVVVTDVEMPRLTGLGLAERIRGDDRTAGLPIIAVTSLAGDEDMARGHAAGIDDYQIKLDRDRLLDSVHKMMKMHDAA